MPSSCGWHSPKRCRPRSSRSRQTARRPSPACGIRSPPTPPDLLLLDLNLPRLSGHEVLQAIKGDAALKRLPVVVLSSSQAEADVARSYELGAASHVAKPGDVDALFALVETLARYWFSAVTLPGGRAAPR